MPSLSEYSKLFLDKELDLDAPRQEGGSAASHDPSLPSIDINQLASLIPNFQGGMDRSVSVQPSAEEVDAPVEPIPQVQDPGFNLNYIKDRLLGKAQAPSQFNVSDLMASVPDTSSVAAEVRPKFVDDSMNARQKDGFWNWLKTKNPSGPIDSSSEANPYNGSVANLDEYYRKSGQGEKADAMFAALAKDDAEGQKVQDDFVKRLTSQTPSGVRVSQLGDDIARIMLGGMPGSNAAAPAEIEISQSRNAMAARDQQLKEEKERYDQEESRKKLAIQQQLADTKAKNAEAYAGRGSRATVNATKKLIAEESAKEADLVTKYASTVESLTKSGLPKEDAVATASGLYGNQLIQSRDRQNELRAEIGEKPNTAPLADFEGIAARTTNNINKKREEALKKAQVKNDQGLPNGFTWASGHQGTKKQAEDFENARFIQLDTESQADSVLDAFKEYDSIDGFSHPLNKGNAARVLDAQLTSLKMKVKEAYRLGAISGPDAGFIDSINGTTLSAIIDSAGGFDTFKTNLENLKKSMERGVKIKGENLGVVQKAAPPPKGGDGNNPPPKKTPQAGKNPPAGTIKVVGGKEYVADGNGGWNRK